MQDRPQSSPDLDTFLEALSSSAPVPGGGSVAALSAAMGAALLAMVASLTLGRKRYEAVRDRVQQARNKAQELRRRARDLSMRDEEAYGLVAQAMALPRDTDEAKAARRARLQDALKAAVQPPLEVMQVAAETVRLAHELAGIGNRSAISDVGSAALTATAAYHAAELNVEINLVGIDDPPWVDATRRSLAAIPSPDEWNAAVQQQVMETIRGRRG